MHTRCFLSKKKFILVKRSDVGVTVIYLPQGHHALHTSLSSPKLWCCVGVTTLLTHVCKIWASCIILILLNLIVMLILEIRESKNVWCHLLLDDWRLWKGLVKGTLGYWKLVTRIIIVTLVNQPIYNHFDTVKKHVYIYVIYKLWYTTYTRKLWYVI